MHQKQRNINSQSQLHRMFCKVQRILSKLQISKSRVLWSVDRLGAVAACRRKAVGAFRTRHLCRRCYTQVAPNSRKCRSWGQRSVWKVSNLGDGYRKAGCTTDNVCWECLQGLVVASTLHPIYRGVAKCPGNQNPGSRNCEDRVWDLVSTVRGHELE